MDEKPKEHEYLIPDLEAQAISRVMKERLKEVTLKLEESKVKFTCFMEVYRPVKQLLNWFIEKNIWKDEHSELAKEMGIEKTDEAEILKQNTMVKKIKYEMDAAIKQIELLKETKLNYENQIKVLEMTEIRSYKKLLKLGREREQ